MKGCTIHALVFLVCLQICSADEPNGTDVTFLQPGTVYIITFAKDVSLFQAHPNTRKITITTGDGDSSELDAVDTTYTDTLQLFKVLKIRGQSWALLEYPASARDWPDWRSSQEAIATLTHDDVQTLGDDEPSRVHLGELQKQYANKIASMKTSKTWVNLAYVTTISPVPPLIDELKAVLASHASREAK